jgi:hypothetical protein
VSVWLVVVMYIIVHVAKMRGEMHYSLMDIRM